ncbi:MAG: DNA/RNA nuclease SfsA [Candidatus Zhuqueibacterota bacterium]
MKFGEEFIPGRLIRRYKRFLADVELESGEIITAHCPNSGSMLTCDTPGSPVLLSVHDNPNRKYAFTWELVLVNSVWVGINTQVPNRLVYEAIRAGEIPELSDYPYVQRERSVSSHSRLDLMLSNDSDVCFVEVKNVTWVEDGVALFPDAKTERGTRHVLELMKLKRQGNRSVMFFVIQRSDARLFAPADLVDAIYGKSLRQAHAQGVEILPYLAQVTPQEICLRNKLEFVF